MTEEQIVEAIRPFTVGIGDDAALWQPSRSHRSVISCDMLVEGVDFTRDAMSLQDAGWRAMAANVSDLAAMGARPVLATVALGLPEATGLEEVRALYRGLAECGERSGLAIVGGDLSRADSLTIAITVVGEVRASSVKKRSGGRAGDVVAVTGPLGAARAGFELTRGPEAIAGAFAGAALRAFRHPEPRHREGRFLAACRDVTAMMDCSDGLSTDLARLAAASGCGAVVEVVPVAEAAHAFALNRGLDPERFALAGGEDFELIAAVRRRSFRHVAGRYARQFNRQLLAIGALRTKPGIEYQGAELERSGWDHFKR